VRLGRGKLLLQLGEEHNELDLPFAHLGPSVDLACPGIKRSPPGARLLFVCTRALNESESLIEWAAWEPDEDVVASWSFHPHTAPAPPWSRGECTTRPGCGPDEQSEHHGALWRKARDGVATV